MTLQDTSNGFLVHWIDNTPQVWLAQYTFAGGLKRTVNLSSISAPVPGSIIFGFNYTSNNGIYLSDWSFINNVVHVFDVNSLVYQKDLTDIFTADIVGIKNDPVGGYQYLFNGGTCIVGYNNGIKTNYNGGDIALNSYPVVTPQGDVFSYDFTYNGSGGANVIISKNGVVFRTFNNAIPSSVNLVLINSYYSKQNIVNNNVVDFLFNCMTTDGIKDWNTIILFRITDNAQLTMVYNETTTDSSITGEVVTDIEYDYNGNVYLGLDLVTGLITGGTKTMQIWAITGYNSHSVFATIASFTQTGVSYGGILKITSYYTETNVGSAVSPGVYLTQAQQNGIPSYKLKNYNAMVK